MELKGLRRLKNLVTVRQLPTYVRFMTHWRQAKCTATPMFNSERNGISDLRGYVFAKRQIRKGRDIFPGHNNLCPLDSTLLRGLNLTHE